MRDTGNQAKYEQLLDAGLEIRNDDKERNDNENATLEQVSDQRRSETQMDTTFESFFIFGLKRFRAFRNRRHRVKKKRLYQKIILMGSVSTVSLQFLFLFLNMDSRHLKNKFFHKLAL